MGFSRQEFWSGLPFPSPGDLPNPGIEPRSPDIARTLKNSILRGQLAHAYLFCGPRGVGKTSAARIFAKTINCANPGPDLEPCGECDSCRSFAEGRSYCIHELDAASNNGVDDIKNLMDQVQIPPQVGRYSRTAPWTSSPRRS